MTLRAYVLCRTHGVMVDLGCAECADVQRINERNGKVEHDHMNCETCRLEAATDYVDRAERDVDSKRFGPGIFVPVTVFRQLIRAAHGEPQ